MRGVIVIAPLLALGTLFSGCVDHDDAVVRTGASGEPVQSACLPDSARLDDYVQSVLDARKREDRQLRGPFSALAKAGFLAVRAGQVATIGSADRNDLTLLDSEVLALHAEIDASVSPVVVRAVPPGVIRTWNADNELYERTEMPLRPGYGFQVGRYTLHFGSSAHLGSYLEVFDPDAAALQTFAGQDYFPVDAAYCVSGTVRSARRPAQVELLDSRGALQRWWLVGTLTMRLEGADAELELYREHEGPIQPGDWLLVIFRDETSGQETYPAARYLNIRIREDGSAIVDFNGAYNPPCVYNALYSCPFARPQNNLQLPIRAGAKWYRLNDY
jgi:uncharacterized protein